jgi:hypothetical protein
MAQQQAQDDAGNIWEVDAQGNPVRLVRPAPSMQRGRVFSLAPSPKEQRQESRQDVQDSRAAAADARAAAAAEREAREWAATHNPDGSPKPTANSNGSAELTAATRANAINAFTATRQLDNLISDIEDRYRRGPGSTRGLKGALDWLPTPGNRAFDAAGNAVRGAAITALGFTSGQTNSPKEVEMNIGPYIPAAGDYDEVITDKIARLKELRDRARVQAVTVLGGVPSADGRINPLSQIPREERDRLFPPGTMQPTGFDGGTPSGPPPASPSAGGPTLGGDGPTLGGPGRRLAPDEMLQFNGDGAPVTGKRLAPDQEAQIVSAIRSGDEGQALALLGRFSGAAPGEGEVASIRAAISQVRKDPRTPIGLNYGKVDAFAQTQADRERFGNALAPAMEERSTAGGLDVSARAGINGLTAGLADYAAAAGGMLGGGSYTENLQRQKALSEADARLNPGNTMISNIVGGAAGAALTEGAASALLPARAAAWAPRVGDAFYGTVAGATGTAPGNEATGAATGGLGGVLGGILGRNVVRGAGNVARGARDASADMLRDRGVPLTVGQLVGQGGRVGQAVKGVEDRLTGVPILGDMINARRREGLEEFNRAAFTEGLGPIGAVGPRDIAEQGIEQGQQSVSDAYSSALNGVNVAPDAQFSTDFGAARSAGQAIPRMGEDFDYVVRDRIDPFLQQGSFNGPAIQDALQGLRAARFSNDSMGDAAKGATGQVEDALTGLVSRQAPDVMPQLDAANGAYRNLSVLADAVGRGANAGGVFTPAQLGMAARSNATKYTGKMNAATTRRPFFDLQRAGQDVLPSAVPDSGTAGRLATLALPGMLGGAGAGAGYLTGDAGGGTTAGLALGSLLAAGGTRNGQRLLAAILADRPDALVAIGEQLNRRAGIGGAIGAPLLAGAGAGQ